MHRKTEQQNHKVTSTRTETASQPDTCTTTCTHKPTDGQRERETFCVFPFFKATSRFTLHPKRKKVRKIEEERERERERDRERERERESEGRESQTKEKVK